MRLMRLTLLLAVSTFAAAQSPTPAQPPWQMQDSGTTAGLRGIYSVDATIAWASGTGGTVLKTIDGGAHWTACAIPDAATDGATLDFRGVQAWDAQTAIVMASGPGEKSRLYKTIDGCKTWKLIFTNPDTDGFWDSFAIDQRGVEQNGLMILGDPVNGQFTMWWSIDGENHWERRPTRPSLPGESAFAASNTALANESWDGERFFGTGGPKGARLFEECEPCTSKNYEKDGFFVQSMKMFKQGDSAGIFSIAADFPQAGLHLVAVGGDYKKPNEIGNAAYTHDRNHWLASTIPPHGFRSAVQWSSALELWITVGTNGSDISRDDGKTWQPLDNGNWNALSLPFVVGPNGRIARLNPAALPPITP
jgi:photosystem II stability/assembly factor-like uncharacterized protein